MRSDESKFGLPCGYARFWSKRKKGAFTVCILLVRKKNEILGSNTPYFSTFVAL